VSKEAKSFENMSQNKTSKTKTNFASLQHRDSFWILKNQEFFLDKKQKAIQPVKKASENKIKNTKKQKTKAMQKQKYL